MFSSYQLKKFHYRAFWHLKEKEESGDMEQGELIRLVETGTELSQERGLKSEEEIITFLRAMIVFEKEYYVEKKWARELFNARDLTSREKAEVLQKAVEHKNHFWIDLDNQWRTLLQRR